MTEYQLVLQFPSSSMNAYDEVCRLEEEMRAIIGEVGDVDGHDAGSNEMNIFILTPHPQRAFEIVKSVLVTGGAMSSVKAAFRQVGTDQFTVLHPRGLQEFSIR